MNKNNYFMDEINNYYEQKKQNRTNMTNKTIEVLNARKDSYLECENVEYFILLMTNKQLEENRKIGEYVFNFPIKNIEKYSFKLMCPEHYDRMSNFFRSPIYESFDNKPCLKNPLSQVRIITNSWGNNDHIDNHIDIDIFY